MNERYGEYEQVNGATCNALMGRVERLETALTIQTEAKKILNRRYAERGKRIAELEALDNIVSAASRIATARAGKNAALEENKGLLVCIRRLEAKLRRVEDCQRYTHHADAYTTDNPTGKWMKSEDVLEAIK